MTGTPKRPTKTGTSLATRVLSGFALVALVTALACAVFAWSMFQNHQLPFLFAMSVAIWLVSTLSILLLAIYLHRSVVSRVVALKDAMRARVSGEDEPISVAGDDEISQMARSVEHLVEELQQRLSSSGFELPIIFLTGHGTVPDSVQALKAGAQDFLEKPVEDELLLAAIERVLALDRSRADHQAEQDETRVCIETLTSRERQVLEQVVAGLLNKQIASKLGIAESTVKVHRGRMMTKLGVDSVPELVRLAETAGEIKREE